MTRCTIFVAVIAAFALSSPPQAVAQSAAALKAVASDAGGVHVVVKPKTLGASAPWEFDVSIDTHIKPLDNDLTKSAALVDSGGRRYTPTAWQGDPPGGHHRKGVLRFPAPEAKAGAFEVQIENVGAPDRRVFKWTLN